MAIFDLENSPEQVGPPRALGAEKTVKEKGPFIGRTLKLMAELTVAIGALCFIAGIVALFVDAGNLFLQLLAAAIVLACLAAVVAGLGEIVCILAKIEANTRITKA